MSGSLVHTLDTDGSIGPYTLDMDGSIGPYTLDIVHIPLIRMVPFIDFSPEK